MVHGPYREVRPHPYPSCPGSQLPLLWLGSDADLLPSHEFSRNTRCTRSPRGSVFSAPPPVSLIPSGLTARNLPRSHRDTPRPHRLRCGRFRSSPVWDVLIILTRSTDPRDLPPPSSDPPRLRCGTRRPVVCRHPLGIFLTHPGLRHWTWGRRFYYR